MAVRSLQLLYALVASAFLAGALHASELVLTQGTNFSVDISRADGRLAIDLLGHIWILSARGGEAHAIGNDTGSASKPRWSPDGRTIIFEVSSPGASQVWVLNPDTGVSHNVGSNRYFNRQPAWHPDGKKIVFSSPRGDTGFDIWQQDIDGGAATQITATPGNESEPAWSANGRALVYVREENNRWSLIINRDGLEQTLVTSGDRLSAPSWRPDGTLIMYQRYAATGASMEMAILSEPPIIRTYADGEDIFAAAASWKDRGQFFYTADGIIKKRNFDARHSQRISFRAYVADLQATSPVQRLQRTLRILDETAPRLVIRAARLFAGNDAGYQIDQDILMEGGRILEVVPRHEWPSETVLDLGDVTALPGFIDSYAALPPGQLENSGPLMLSLGITTLVAADTALKRNFDKWQSDQYPGPRVLRSAIATEPVPAKTPPDLALVQVPSLTALDERQRANIEKWRTSGVPLLVRNWRAGLGLDADLALGIHSMPASPGGKRYQDLQLSSNHNPVTLISGLAGANTPDTRALLESDQGRLLDRGAPPTSSYANNDQRFGAEQPAVILGSQPNGFPAGLALHAELRAMQAAGLSAEYALRSATANAAQALGYENDIGTIRAGAMADIVIVSGDPLSDVRDAFNVVAVVHDGHFYSVGGLLDRATAPVNLDE